MFEEARNKYFFLNSQNRKLRRKMAKKLGLMKQGWQNIKDDFPPYNKPKDLGINEFKKVVNTNKSLSSSQRNKAVLQYKSKAKEVLADQLTKEEQYDKEQE